MIFVLFTLILQTWSREPEAGGRSVTWYISGAAGDIRENNSIATEGNAAAEREQCFAEWGCEQVETELGDETGKG